MNTKHLYILLLFLLFGLPAAAQPNQGDLESVRIAFITRKLSLTPDEAKVFWPVYDAYQAELKGVKEGMRSDLKAAKNDFDGLSDKEVEKVVDHYLDSKLQEMTITQKYHKEFKAVLPIRKVAKLYKAEQDFTKLLLKRLQERQAGNKGGPPGGRRRRF